VTIEDSQGTRRRLGGIALFLLAATLIGCGGREAPGPNESPADQLAAELRALPDRALNPKVFRELFVEGAAPSDEQRPNYAKYGIRPAAPSIDGDNATVQVSIYDDRAGKDVGTVTWTLVKQGDKWKLKTAPLP